MITSSVNDPPLPVESHSTHRTESSASTPCDQNPLKRARTNKNERRSTHRKVPLNREIRNGNIRAKRAWDRGLYGNLPSKTPGGESMTSGMKRPPLYMAKCTYYSACGSIQSAYELRRVRTVWSELIALWSLEGVVCVPIEFVEDGHRDDHVDPGPPPSCLVCDEVSFSNSLCTACGAQMFFWPT